MYNFCTWAFCKTAPFWTRFHLILWLRQTFFQCIFAKIHIVLAALKLHLYGQSLKMGKISFGEQMCAKDTKAEKLSPSRPKFMNWVHLELKKIARKKVFFFSLRLELDDPRIAKHFCVWTLFSAYITLEVALGDEKNFPKRPNQGCQGILPKNSIQSWLDKF